MKFTLVWLRETWPIYRRYVEQRRWRKARDYMFGYMLPACDNLSLSEMLCASGALVGY